MLGDLGRENRSVLDAHEDSSTKSTTQFASEVEFRKRSNVNQSFHGNIIEALEHYDTNFSNGLKLKNFNRMITIGSDSMMKAVSYAIQNDLKNLFDPNIKSFASVNSSMQCMMKEICGQCIQEHIDPLTGVKSYVFSCFNQDQKLGYVNFVGLNARLRQNSVQEKVTAQWIACCLERNDVSTVASQT